MSDNNLPVYYRVCDVPRCGCSKDCHLFEVRSRQSLSKWRSWTKRLDEAFKEDRGSWKRTFRVCKCHFHESDILYYNANEKQPNRMLKIKDGSLPFFNEKQKNDHKDINKTMSSNERVVPPKGSLIANRLSHRMRIHYKTQETTTSSTSQNNSSISLPIFSKIGIMKLNKDIGNLQGEKNFRCNVPGCPCLNNCHNFQARTRQTIAKWREWVDRLNEAFPEKNSRWPRTLRICKCHWHEDDIHTFLQENRRFFKVKHECRPCFNDRQRLEEEVRRKRRNKKEGKSLRFQTRASLLKSFKNDPNKRSLRTESIARRVDIDYIDYGESEEEEVTSQVSCQEPSSVFESQFQTESHSEEVEHKEIQDPSQVDAVVAEVYEIHEEDEIYEKITASP